MDAAEIIATVAVVTLWVAVVVAFLVGRWAGKEEALADAKEVLTRGKAFRGWRNQYGQALWQKFIPGNSHVLRYTQITPRYGWLLKVMNRPNDWRASGSGLCVPVTA